METQPRFGELQIKATEFSTNTLFELIASDFLNIESIVYRDGNPMPPEGKILFLIGDSHKDVTRSKTFDGKNIYTKTATHTKLPEIFEAISAISNHFDMEPNLPRVVSEVADVVYNLVQLTHLDQNFSFGYKICIEEITSSLGISIHDLLLATLLKYHLRMVINKGEKNIEEEEAIFTKLFQTDGGVLPSPLQEPTKEEIENTYITLNEIEDGILTPRLRQLKWLWDRKVIAKDHISLTSGEILLPS